MSQHILFNYSRDMKPVIKNKEEVDSLYIGAIRQWLISSPRDIFFDGDYKATHWIDFVCFNQPLDRHHLVMPGECLLIDRTHEGEYWFVICTISKSGRVKHIAPVVRVGDVRYGDWKNGYFLLPRFDFNN